MDDTALARVAAAVAATGDRAQRANVVADLIRRGTGARWVGVYSVAGGVVTNEAWSGPAAPAHPTFPVTQGLTGHAVRTGSIAMSNDVGADPRYLINQDDSGSELIVPVLADGRVVGTLDIESDTVGRFGGAEIARYESLAAALRPLWI